MNLLEKYSNTLNAANRFYNRMTNENMDTNRQLCTAMCLDNTARFLTESVSAGVQRSDIGNFKRFALDLTALAVPTLISHDLVLVKPMNAMTGLVTYMKYSYGTTKGTTTAGTEVNTPFKLGSYDVNYTGKSVVEAKTDITSTEITAKKVERTLAWKPVMAGFVELVNGTLKIHDMGDGKLYKGLTVSYEKKVDKVTGAVTFVQYSGTGTQVGTIDYTTGAIVLGDGSTIDSSITATTLVVNYSYDNAYIPQNDVPVLTATMESKALYAQPRRIAIRYSQMAEFQFKSEYGADLNKNLSEQAVGTMQYEIDKEVTNLLIDTAKSNTAVIAAWSRTLPTGVSKQEHYAGFVEQIEIGKQKIYDATKRFQPNWMLCSSSLLPILSFIPSFKAATINHMNGAFFAGTLNGLKVFVTPNIDVDSYVLGVNGADAYTSAAVLAPYMAIVPTQLLQFADGDTSQGFSTLYALELLNADLVIRGTVTA